MSESWDDAELAVELDIDDDELDDAWDDNPDFDGGDDDDDE